MKDNIIVQYLELIRESSISSDIVINKAVIDTIGNEKIFRFSYYKTDDVSKANKITSVLIEKLKGVKLNEVKEKNPIKFELKHDYEEPKNNFLFSIRLSELENEVKINKSNNSPPSFLSKYAKLQDIYPLGDSLIEKRKYKIDNFKLPFFVISIVFFALSVYDSRIDILKELDSNYLFIFATLFLIASLIRSSSYYIAILPFSIFAVWSFFDYKLGTPELSSNVILICSSLILLIKYSYDELREFIRENMNEINDNAI